MHAHAHGLTSVLSHACMRDGDVTDAAWGEQGAREVRGVKAYNVDDLKAVVAANQARRQRLISEAEMVISLPLSVCCVCARKREEHPHPPTHTHTHTHTHTNRLERSRSCGRS
jgi:glutamyl-tRNA reductase